MNLNVHNIALINMEQRQVTKDRGVAIRQQRKDYIARADFTRFPAEGSRLRGFGDTSKVSPTPFCLAFSAHEKA